MQFVSVSAVLFPREQLPYILKKHSIFTNAYAEKLFAHPDFFTDSFPDELQVGIAPLYEIGFRHGATLREISEVLPDYGLKPCPASTGLFLRIAWKEQKQSSNSVLTGTHQAPDQAVTVFTRILDPDDAFPKGLYLRNVDGKLWLRGYVCDNEYRWSCDDLFAFEKCRTE